MWGLGGVTDAMYVCNAMQLTSACQAVNVTSMRVHNGSPCHEGDLQQQAGPVVEQQADDGDLRRVEMASVNQDYSAVTTR